MEVLERLLATGGLRTDLITLDYAVDHQVGTAQYLPTAVFFRALGERERTLAISGNWLYP